MSPRVMPRPTLVVALAAVATGAVLTAAPAQAAGYSATITLSAAKADVGKKITATGKVTGKGSAHKTVKLQYRNASGTWSSVKTLSTSSKGTYKVSFTVRTAGARALRLAVPAKGTVKKGYSPAAAFTGWRWLSLYDESYYSSGVIIRGWNSALSGTVNGGRPPRETLTFVNSEGENTHSYASWRLERTCDELRAEAGASDSLDSTTYVTVIGSTTKRYAVVPSEITSISMSLTDSFSTAIRRTTGDGDSYMPIERARVHCMVDSLPISSD